MDKIRTVGLRFGALFFALAVAACASGDKAEDDKKFSRFAATEVLTAGFAGIADKYIEPVSAGTLALEGLRGLGAIDPGLAVSADDGTVVMTSGGEVVAQRPAPAEDDLRGWTRLAVEMSAEGRRRSAELGAASIEKIYEAVFDGALSNLDVYSRYAGAEEAQKNRARRDGYGGIGIRLRVIGNEIRVANVMPDSPAERVGILKNDRLTHVGSVPIDGMSVHEISRQLRGPSQSHVTLRLLRDGNMYPLLLNVERAHIVPATVDITTRDGVIYAKVSSFNQDTAHSLEVKIMSARDALGGTFRGLVLDLRGNPGGLLKQSVKVADLFLAQGRILATRGRHPDSLQHYEAAGRDIVDGRPIIIMIDGKSASAAEIVAAALQDRDRAVIVGTTSYGKGTVQTVIRLPNEGEITLTWSRLLTPSGYALHGLGVRPTICTSGTGDAEKAIRGALAVTSGVATALAAWRRVGVADEDARHELRATCPSDPHDQAVDIAVAGRLLAEQPLYDGARGLRGTTAEARH